MGLIGWMRLCGSVVRPHYAMSATLIQNFIIVMRNYYHPDGRKIINVNVTEIKLILERVEVVPDLINR